MKRDLGIVSVAVLSAALCSAPASGQAYPTKPIKVSTAAAGGTIDTILRLVTSGISQPLGQQFVVDNKPSTLHPEDDIAKTVAPDGYSLLFKANDLWLAPYLRANVPYEPLRDFAPISLVATGPSLVAISTSLPVNTLAELIALAKSKPGELNVTATGFGTTTHRASLLFQHATGTKFTDIKYSATAQAVADVAAARVHLTFATGVASFVKAGKIKVLAVTSLEPTKLHPGIPSVASFGYPGFESVIRYGLFAPPKTPPAIIARLNQEIVKYLATEDAVTKINNLGFEVVASSPERLRAAMQSEMNNEGKALRDFGILPM